MANNVVKPTPVAVTDVCNSRGVLAPVAAYDER